MHKLLKKLDKQIKSLGFDLYVDLGNFTLALTDNSIGNKKLLNFGIKG
jgi:hypothetical protein